MSTQSLIQVNTKVLRNSDHFTPIIKTVVIIGSLSLGAIAIWIR